MGNRLLQSYCWWSLQQKKSTASPLLFSFTQELKKNNHHNPLPIQQHDAVPKHLHRISCKRTSCSHFQGARARRKTNLQAAQIHCLYVYHSQKHLLLLLSAALGQAVVSLDSMKVHFPLCLIDLPRMLLTSQILLTPRYVQNIQYLFFRISFLS